MKKTWKSQVFHENLHVWLLDCWWSFQAILLNSWNYLWSTTKEITYGSLIALSNWYRKIHQWRVADPTQWKNWWPESSALKANFGKHLAVTPHDLVGKIIDRLQSALDSAAQAATWWSFAFGSTTLAMKSRTKAAAGSSSNLFTCWDGDIAEAEHRRQYSIEGCENSSWGMADGCFGLRVSKTIGSL